ncbi:hypothetical protein [Nocardiopsis sp. FIRDI 009]|uniref:hypothetical protein n=1 Tax=Nocardiopsis sp. FIRDI 009 TaxID=714197 RepID=UPI000E235F3C|nr:hypothetical protein [Nocardiopsis sp. FIRDI 009]
MSVNTSAGTVQVRYGTHRGRQYGWGRALNSSSGYLLLFEVDHDGDRAADYATWEDVCGVPGRRGPPAIRRPPGAPAPSGPALWW